MGANYRVYVGPYIRCSTRTKPYKKEIKVCSARGCRFARKDNPMADQNHFCPQCGAAAKVMKVTVKGTTISVIDSYEVLEATNERITEFNAEYQEDGIHLFVPNQSRPRRFVYERGDAPCGQILQVQSSTLEEETGWLEAAFEDDIAKITEIYGDGKVEICWGVLGEWM